MRKIWNNCLPRTIAPFWCENRHNRPWLLFKEIQYVCTILISDRIKSTVYAIANYSSVWILRFLSKQYVPVRFRAQQ